MADSFDLANALQDIIQNDPEAAHQLGQTPGGNIESENDDNGAQSNSEIDTIKDIENHINTLKTTHEAYEKDSYLKGNIIPLLCKINSVTRGRYRKLISKECGITVNDIKSAEKDYRDSLKAKEKPKTIRKFQSLLIEICSDEMPSTVRYYTLFQRTNEFMIDQGRFYRTPNSQNTYYFRNDEKTLLDMESEGFSAYLSNLTALSPSDINFKAILTRTKAWARENGHVREIQQITFFDKTRKISYMDCYGGTVLKCDGSNITIIDNGSEVLFLRPGNAEPWSFKPEEARTGGKLLPDGRKSGGVLLRELCNIKLVDDFTSTDNQEAEKKRLAQQEMARTTLICAILNIFFMTLIAGLPITLLKAETNSGKTLLLQRIMKILFGSRGNVDSVREAKETDFATKLINSVVCAIDNVDTKISWLPDLIAVAATNGIISNRKLYTTAELVEYPLRVQLFLTARTPLSLRRDDIASRLIVFRLSQIESFEGGEILIRESLINRDSILSSLAMTVNDMVKVLKEEFRGELPKINSGMRLNDFCSVIYLYLATQALKKGKTLDDVRSRANKIFDRIKAEQLLFLGENDAELECVSNYLERYRDKIGIWIPASEFFKNLKNFALINSGYELSMSSSAWLGRRLTEKAKALEALYKIKFESGRNKKGMEWRFTRIRDDVAVAAPPGEVKNNTQSHINEVVELFRNQ